MKTTFKIILFALGLFLVTGVFTARTARAGEAMASPQSDFQRLVAVLQYLQGDYPTAVASKDEGELKEQSSFIAEAVEIAHKAGAPAESYLARLESIAARIGKGEDATGVSRDCSALVEAIVAEKGLTRSPRETPDFERGRALFSSSGCTTCHGETGHADTEAAKKLDPPPANFFDPERMAQLTPFRAFNAVTYGLKGTAMVGFAQTLEERDRWALAFYVTSLRHATCAGEPPRAPLEQLANSTDAQLAAAYGDGAVACLRTKFAGLDDQQQLVFAQSEVERAAKLAAEGRWDEARQAVLDAYLKGVEPVEVLLRARDASLVTELEAAFLETRVSLEHHDTKAVEQSKRLVEILERARRSGASRSSAASVFWFSLLIIVREGFEATVIIAALLAVLKKLGQRAQARVVHAGWISAIAVGAVAFVFGQQLVTGENREKIEGIFALLAVGMLLHAALWLNARSTTRKMMGDLRQKMTSAAMKQSSVALFAISFSAMFRESFETAIFLQGLSIDAPRAVVWGTIVGVVVLLGLVFGVDRLGLRLPMQTLFRVSTIVLVVTAVVLLGKGIHALQEVGILPLRPVRFVRFELLGVFPDVLSLAPQVVLALAPLIWRFVKRAPTPASDRA